MNLNIINEVIEEVTEGIYKDYPILFTQFGESGKQKCREDNHHHFKHLKIAVEMDNEQFFTDYAHWLNNILTSRGMQTAHLIDNFSRIERSLRTREFTNKQEYISLLQAAVRSLK